MSAISRTDTYVVSKLRANIRVLEDLADRYRLAQTTVERNVVYNLRADIVNDTLAIVDELKRELPEEDLEYPALQNFEGSLLRAVAEAAEAWLQGYFEGAKIVTPTD